MKARGTAKQRAGEMHIHIFQIQMAMRFESECRFADSLEIKARKMAKQRAVIQQAIMMQQVCVCV